MRRRLLSILTFLSIALAPVAAQQSMDDPLVKVGDIVITRREFLSRYEMTPAVNRRASDAEADKGAFLISMIAEKLLVLKAREEGWNNDSVLNSAVEQIERLFVRDELFRQEVAERITITDAERRLGFQRSLNDMKVYFLYARTKEGADFLLSQIRKGKPLESFNFTIESKDEFDGPDSAIARWGDVDERMEQVIYNLKLNETSKPVQLEDGWYIVKLMGKTVSVLVGEKERKGQMEKVDAVLRKRKEQVRMTEYMNTELKDIRTDVRAKVLKSTVLHLWDIAQQRFPRVNDTTMFFYDKGAIELLRAVMADTLRHTFVVFPHTQWSLEDALLKISETNLTTLRPTLRRIRQDFEQRLKEVIDQEYLVQAGYRKGLQRSAAVQNDLKVWRESFQAQRLRDRVEDTVALPQSEVEEVKQAFRTDTSIANNDAAAREKLKQLKVNDRIERYIGSVANQASITFYEKNFTETKVTSTTALVYRYLGFGGRMFAVPFVTPQVGWILYWNNKNISLP